MGEIPVPDLDDRCALFLDIDGTLVEVAADRDKVTLDAPTRRLIGRLREALGGALALVSGRRLRDIDRMSGGLALAVAAEHGAELRGADGRVRQLSLPPGWRETIAELDAAAARTPGLDLEEKDLSAALHYRAAPALAGLARELADKAAARLGAGYRLRDGKMVVEIAPAGVDKGEAIAEMLSEPCFTGRRPVFAGDDLTDEDGFALVNARDGISLKVGPGPTVAHYRLDDVAAMRAWLARQAQRLERSNRFSERAR